MVMKPLQQWICDRCGQIVENPKDGWLEWLSGDKENRQAHGFKLVHHATAAPTGRRCYHYDNQYDRADMHLTDMIGPNLPALYRFLDVGPRHDPDRRHLPGVRDLREFMEILRRLTLPYYEEARFYFESADEDGFFDGANEVWIYLPDTLRELIDRYGPK